MPNAPVRRFRFSLRSLIIFIALITSGTGLWYRWEPWTRAHLGSPRSISTGTARWIDFNGVTFSPDEKRMAVYYHEGATLLDPATGVELAMMPGASIVRWDLENGRLVAIGPSWTRLLDADTGETIRIRGGSMENIWRLIFLDDRRLMTIHEDVSQVWEIESGMLLNALVTPGYARGAAVSPDGSRVVISSGAGRPKVYDARDWRVTVVLEADRDPDFDQYEDLNNVAWSPDGKRIAMQGALGLPRVWDAITGRRIFAIHEAPPEGGYGLSWDGVYFTPDGRRVFIARDLSGKEVIVWDAETGEQQEVYTDIDAALQMLSEGALRPDGDLFLRDSTAILTWGKGVGNKSQDLPTVEIRDARTKDVTASRQFSAEWLQVKPAPSGERIAVALMDKSRGAKVQILDGRTLEVLREINGDTWPHGWDLAERARTSIRGRWMYLDGQIWDARRRQPVRDHVSQDMSTEAPVVQFLHDEVRMITEDKEDVLTVQDIATGQVLATLGKNPGHRYASQVSADGERLLIVAEQTTRDPERGTSESLWYAREYDLRSGSMRYEVKFPEMKVESNIVGTNFSITPDLTRIFVADGGREDPIEVWNPRTGKRIGALPGNWSRLTMDGRVAAKMADFSIDFRGPPESYRLYDPETLEPVPLPPVHDEERHFLSASFSPGGTYIVETDSGHGLWLWRRRRPEYWWGVAWLPEFWVTLILAGALLWSLRRDRIALKPAAEPNSASPDQREG